MGHDNALTGPDFEQGIPISDLPDVGMLLGHAAGKPVLLARRDGEFFAVDGMCTHYGAPLADGLLVGTTVRCPWHHACFDLRTGTAVKAPALRPLTRWNVVRRDASVVVGDEIQSTPTAPLGDIDRSTLGQRIVIVGAGAAADAAAD